MEFLRLARPDDWEAVNSLCRQVHNLHVSWRPDIFSHTDNTYPMKYFLEDIQNEHIYVAQIKCDVVAYVLFHIWNTNGEGSVPSKVLDIDGIAVDEKYRGQGVGKQIIEDIKKLAICSDCNDIQLSVYPQNENAIRFYEGCGFKVRNIRYQMYL